LKLEAIKMRNHLLLIVQLLRNMGFRYVLFRTCFEIQRRAGLLKIRFPKHSRIVNVISLADWRDQSAQFFTPDYQSLSKLKCKQDFESLQRRVEAIHNDEFQYFSCQQFHVLDWHTNSVTGFTYDRNQHWSEIPDFSQQAGDIKYVWEKSRFTFLYDLIRYDFHFGEDQSRMVFDKIESWIDSNPVNCGPNWKCCQEISLRVFNWTFALHYYKYSDQLTEFLFAKIANSIYQQMNHVAGNIQFSRIAVRNNHALTETLGLYLTGMLFPSFPESKHWKEKGEKWFEEEVEYQIDEFGAFLQHSMNYHRVVIQLLTRAIKLAELNGESWNETVYDRARKSLKFLRSFQDDKTGWLPNYGNNDGALFFPLSECHFRDYRPQLTALANVLHVELDYGPGDWEEESFWLGGLGRGHEAEGYAIAHAPCPKPLSQSGYYLLRESDSLTFIRCGSYKHRPFQADNLHVDIWVNGENILRDAGSFSYYTDHEMSRYFMGTASHNTVILGDSDQMKKGPGFIWYNWIEKSEGEWNVNEEKSEVVFEGYFEGFKHLGSGIIHRRRLTKKLGVLRWVVEDWIENLPPGINMNQLWHPSETFLDRFTMKALDKNECEIIPVISSGWYAEYYGHKTESQQITFSTKLPFITTVIEFL
jgi:hypothetical protein